MGIDAIEELYSQTLRLISLYHLHGHPIPFGLKGNLGEFHVQIELLRRFPEIQPDFRGGSFPGVDIFVKDVKIQVKTQIKHPPMTFRGGLCDLESSPTIKKAILDSKKADFVILVILYPSDGFTQIEKSNVYIFDKSEFRYFSPILCWSGSSKGDYTIVNVLKVEGNPPPKLLEKINHYRTEEYSQLFSTAKDNWGKLKNAMLDEN